MIIDKHKKLQTTISTPSMPVINSVAANKRALSSSLSAQGEIQQHLQAMLHILRPQDTLKMAVRLESVLGCHTRYMAIVSSVGRQDNAESIVLGIDHVSTPTRHTSIGLVLPVWASTHIALDGDGGICVESSGTQHTFKPVSVQAMWSAFQSLHKEHEQARRYPYFPGGLTHTWVQYYESSIDSPEAYRSEWHYTPTDDVDLKADAMDRYRQKPPEREAAEKSIRVALKDIMQTVDLDEVTSKDIRIKLEERLELNLTEYKEFIDQEMLVILGQMDKPSKIFDYLYLGTEWNASNWDELRANNVAYIINVTKEVDNFFPGLFNYMKIRVSDEESAELIKHWDVTYKFIQRAKEHKQAVLVHCKKGISRSSSTVIAYAMKEYGWPLDKSLNYVKDRRNCITPNKGFMEQLKTYEGILDASSHRNSEIFNRLPMLFPSATCPTFTNAAHIRAVVHEAHQVMKQHKQRQQQRNTIDEQEEEEEQTDADTDRVEVTSLRKLARPLSMPEEMVAAPSGLLVASENILKACPPPPLFGTTTRHSRSMDDGQTDIQSAAPTAVTDWSELLGVARGPSIDIDLCHNNASNAHKSSTNDQSASPMVQLPECSSASCVQDCRTDADGVISRPPVVLRTLQSAEQRIRTRESNAGDMTLKDMQTILMRTSHKRNSSGGSRQSSSSGASSLETSGDDTTSLESSTSDGCVDAGAVSNIECGCDNDDGNREQRSASAGDPTQPPKLKRRSSKSSSGSNGSAAGDSAVADLSADLLHRPSTSTNNTSDGVEHPIQRHRSNDCCYKAYPARIIRPKSLNNLPIGDGCEIGGKHNNDTRAQPDSDRPMPGVVRRVTQTYEEKQRVRRRMMMPAAESSPSLTTVGGKSLFGGRKTIDSSSKHQHKLKKPGAGRKFLDKIFGNTNAQSSEHQRTVDDGKQMTLQERKMQFGVGSADDTEHHSHKHRQRRSLKVSQPGKVKDEREKLERLSREIKESDATGVTKKTVTTPVSKHTSQGVPNVICNDVTDMVATDDNLVRSLVGVFECSQSTSLPTNQSQTSMASSGSRTSDNNNTSAIEPHQSSSIGPFPPVTVERLLTPSKRVPVRQRTSVSRSPVRFSLGNSNQNSPASVDCKSALCLTNSTPPASDSNSVHMSETSVTSTERRAGSCDELRDSQQQQRRSHVRRVLL